MANVCWTAAHRCGALVIHQVVDAARLVPSPSSGSGEWERRFRVGGLVGTLLGPEGTGFFSSGDLYCGARTALSDGGVVLVGPVVF